jgi:hypothetical protein
LEALERVQDAEAGLTCAGAYVLNEVRHDATGKATEWATHWRNDDLGGHCWGHYFRDEAAAQADHAERVAHWQANHAAAA